MSIFDFLSLRVVVLGLFQRNPACRLLCLIAFSANLDQLDAVCGVKAAQKRTLRSGRSGKIRMTVMKNDAEFSNGNMLSGLILAPCLLFLHRLVGCDLAWLLPGWLACWFNRPRLMDGAMGAIGW
jgi:hypothetical protein